jgi:hypothetical protein
MKLIPLTGLTMTAMLSSSLLLAAEFTISIPSCTTSLQLVDGVLSCVEGSGEPPPVVTTPECTVSASPSTITAGATSTVSASCSNTPTSWLWTVTNGGPTIGNVASAELTFPSAGSYQYRVTGTNGSGDGTQSPSRTVTVNSPPPTGSCTTPPGTTVINVGASGNFDIPFDNPGSVIDSSVAANATKAYAFTNNAFKTGYLSGSDGNYGAIANKDWSLSLCPGDFTTSLGAACLVNKRKDPMIGYSTNGTLGCTIPVNTTVYLNIRGTAGATAGFVVSNIPTSTLP